jgi:hypothetical protein
MQALPSADIAHSTTPLEANSPGVWLIPVDTSQPHQGLSCRSAWLKKVITLPEQGDRSDPTDIPVFIYIDIHIIALYFIHSHIVKQEFHNEDLFSKVLSRWRRSGLKIEK